MILYSAMSNDDVGMALYKNYYYYYYYVRPETDGREDTGGTGLFRLVFVDLERAYDTVRR